MNITSIQTTDVARITSGQVIIELLSVVKELVENSIDANSDKIDVTFHNHGTTLVEVSDNGLGIEKEDFQSLCLKHYTSKLDSFEGLSYVNTLGFRGEAMSSLCSVAKIKISTCTASSYPKATELVYDNLGRLMSQKTKVTGKKGTTVTVSSLFHDMPVRQKNFIKHAKREYSKCLSVLMGYLLGYTHIRFAVYNLNESSGKKSMALGSRGGNSTVSDVLASIFGSNGAHGLVAVELNSKDIDARFKLAANTVPVSLNMKVSGWISDYSFGMGRGATDRQFLYINKRPVTHKRFTKVINETYRTFNTTQSPVYVLNIEIDSIYVDQNVTPDKRMVMVQGEEVLCEVLREELAQFYETRHNSVPVNTLHASSGSQPKAIMQEEQLGDTRVSCITGDLGGASSEIQLRKENCGSSPVQKTPQSCSVASSGVRRLQSTKAALSAHEASEHETVLSVTHMSNKHDSGKQPLKGHETTFSVVNTETPESDAKHPRHKLAPNHAPSMSTSSETASLDNLRGSAGAPAILTENNHTQSENCPKPQADMVLTTAVDVATSEPSKSEVDDFADLNENILESLFVEDSPPVMENSIQASAVVSTARCDMRRTYCVAKFMFTTASSEQKCASHEPLLANVLNLQDSLEIHKNDFNCMQVVGQFNLGFIVVIHGNRLFIVDQHALDEIYNYERLMDSLVLRAQPLVIPRVLELSPIDEMVLLENVQNLRRNGFVVEEDMDGVPGRRVRLIALPVLKNVVFDDGDLHELMHKLHENGFSRRASMMESQARRTVRCTKVDGMIALRACRKSIMIGQSLGKGTMSRVVRHLAELDKPWNCPHGRPTMRHLADLELRRFTADYIL